MQLPPQAHPPPEGAELRKPPLDVEAANIEIRRITCSDSQLGQAGRVVAHREEPFEEVPAGRAFVLVERHGWSVTGSAYAVVPPPVFGAKREYSQSRMTATTMPPIHAMPR